MKKRLPMYFIFLLLCCNGSAQTIENVNFIVNNNKIIVTYDLVNCKNNEVYDIRLKFKSENTNFVPVNIKGDVKRVSEGRNKRIEWDVIADGIEITESIQAIVEIQNSYSTKTTASSTPKIKGGPSNALLSLLIPGLGDYFVDKYSKEGQSIAYWIPILYFGAAGYSYYNYHNYINYYSLSFLPTVTQETYKENFIGYGLLAAAILVLDVIHVYNKGVENRKRGLNSFNNNIKINWGFIKDSYQIGLVKTF